MSRIVPQGKAINVAGLLKQMEQCRQAQIDAVLAEFGGDTDASAALTRMAEALLHYRQWLRQLVDAGEMIQRGKPFIVLGPGPYWKPDCANSDRTQCIKKSLFSHLVGTGEQRRRNVDAERLGGLQIDGC
jgi:hypothetical protein